MTARRKVAAIAAAGVAPLALTALSAVARRRARLDDGPGQPGLRVLRGGARGPKSAACKAAVRRAARRRSTTGTAVNIANAAGKRRR